MAKTVKMLCLTTKQSFEVDNPPVVVLANGRFAYRAPCPWVGKNGKQLYAFKFCGYVDFEEYKSSIQDKDEDEEKTE